MRRVYSTVSLPDDDRQLRVRLTEYLREISEAINQAAGGRLRDFVDVTGTYAAGIADLVIQVAPSGTCTITLPAASDTKGVIYTVKRTNNTTHTITVAGSTGNIDGAASVTLTTAYQVRHFYSDGTNYWTH